MSFDKFLYSFLPSPKRKTEKKTIGLLWTHTCLGWWALEKEDGWSTILFDNFRIKKSNAFLLFRSSDAHQRSLCSAGHCTSVYRNLFTLFLTDQIIGRVLWHTAQINLGQTLHVDVSSSQSILFSFRPHEMWGAVEMTSLYAFTHTFCVYVIWSSFLIKRKGPIFCLLQATETFLGWRKLQGWGWSWTGLRLWCRGRPGLAPQATRTRGGRKSRGW